MPSFPRHTDAFPIPAGGGASFRTVPRSLVAMAAITGAVLRLSRSLLLGGGAADVGPYVWTLYLLGTAFLLGMVALHLSNYTVRRWLWRAPAFVLVEVSAELLTSALLIALGREPWGTGTADWDDWPTIAAAALVVRTALVLPFALALAAVVQGARIWLARRRLLGEP